MRHSWLKLRLHVYLCRRCGCGRVNRSEPGQWVTTFHRPDGTETMKTPPCERGPLTGKYIAAHAAEFAMGELGR